MHNAKSSVPVDCHIETLGTERLDFLHRTYWWFAVVKMVRTSPMSLCAPSLFSSVFLCVFVRIQRKKKWKHYQQFSLVQKFFIQYPPEAMSPSPTIWFLIAVFVYVCASECGSTLVPFMICVVQDLVDNFQISLSLPICVSLRRSWCISQCVWVIRRSLRMRQRRAWAVCHAMSHPSAPCCSSIPQRTCEFTYTHKYINVYRC